MATLAGDDAIFVAVVDTEAGANVAKWLRKARGYPLVRRAFSQPSRAQEIGADRR